MIAYGKQTYLLRNGQLRTPQRSTDSCRANQNAQNELNNIKDGIEAFDFSKSQYGQPRYNAVEAVMPAVPMS
jgi:hypothetical protein